jgi:hypothetical protein
MLKKLLICSCVVLAFSITAFCQDAAKTKPAAAEEEFKTVTVKKFVFSYLVSGENLKVKVSCPTSGWVSVGFNPTEKMKDANYIIGYSAKGTAFVDDQFGNSPYGHKSDTELGGKNDIVESACTEENGITTLTFTIPLNSGDVKDRVLEKGKEAIVIFGAGKKDDFKKKHFTRAKTTITL